ncbi:hypothetical protein GUJ93_ZPchr0003g16625 [Zizania palustris]|uniref:Uncharacterized protein n=1 Tax=Zizania palustris TaxID=103762 RepID=A0A8J5S8X9_ZIZPA|nr:hypothetical protein GUJ93_ZPchr0003g16625 [Zizania palustris]
MGKNVIAQEGDKFTSEPHLSVRSWDLETTNLPHNTWEEEPRGLERAWRGLLLARSPASGWEPCWSAPPSPPRESTASSAHRHLAENVIRHVQEVR